MVINHNNIQVFYRVFPTEESCWDLVKLKDKKVFVRYLQEPKTKKYGDIGLLPFWEFTCERVFINTSQNDVFMGVTQDLLDSVIKGSGVIITAYGQTGSGKSFTLGGLELEREEDFGIVPKFITKLYQLRSGLPKHIRISFHMSYLEFSQHDVFDLLQQFPNSIHPYHCRRKCTKVKVKTEYEALKQLYIGEARKNTIDYQTYYSHIYPSVVTFYVTTRNLDFSSNKKHHTKIHVIDYSGIDTVGNVSSTFKSASQIGEADLEKSSLELFFMYLIGKETDAKTKQRLSPLIFYLGEDILNSQMRFIGHIKVTKEDLPITISVLKFGQLIQGLKLLVREYVFEEDDHSKSERLQAQLDQMKLEKIQNSILLNQDLGRSLDHERIEHLRRTVRNYLQNKITEIKILNVAEASAVFRIFREFCQQVRSEKLKLARSLTKSFASETSLIKHKDSGGQTQYSQVFKTDETPRKNKRRKSHTQAEATAKPEMVEASTSIQSFFLSPQQKRSYSLNTGSKTSLSPSKFKTHKLTSHTTTLSKRKLLSDVKVKSKTTIMGDRGSLMRMEFVLDSIPDNEEAWSMYILETSYKNLYKEYMKNQNVMNESYEKYLDEMKFLEEITDKVEERKNDLHEAQMFLRFSLQTPRLESTYTENAVLTEAKLMCEERLKDDQQKLQQQQEEVLKLQSLLKLHLDIKKDLKKQINQEFRTFCSDRYGFILPNLQGITEHDTMSTALDVSTKPEEDADNLDENIVSQKKDAVYDNNYIMELKKLLHQERQKNSATKERSKISWK